MLVTIVLAVAFAVFVGHGIARHTVMPIIWGCGFLAAALVLAYLQTRDAIPESADSKHVR